MASMAYREPGDLARVRSFVRSGATDLGLPAGRAELLVLAISELATNTLQHTTGSGEVRLWKDGRQIVCEIVDEGRHTVLGPMPAADSLRGRGLPIVHRVVDHMSVFTHAGTTVVQIRMDC